MTRLSTYIVRLLTRETLGLLAVMLGLLFLIQCLKIFDVVVVQGQNFLTLVGQALLGMPPLAAVIAYVCMGIGVVRALSSLQGSHELHIIHASRQVGGLLRGIAVFAIGGTAVVLVLSNWVEPSANRQLSQWAASVTADIVGRTLSPHRVSRVVPGVVLIIGGRQGTGDITDFFADDTRDPQTRRTFVAKTAKVGTSDNGYVLELHNGTVQYLTAQNEFSQVSFDTYNIALDKLAAADPDLDNLGTKSSWDVITGALSTGAWTPDVLKRLSQRLANGLNAFAMCVFMGAVMLFPSGRRSPPRLPMELLPLIVAFVENAIGSVQMGVPGLPALVGPVLVLVTGLVILGVRFRPRRLPRTQVARFA